MMYFDHSATTPLNPKVMSLMVSKQSELYGNPSSIHFHGQKARALLEIARKKIATSINGYMTNAHAIATASPLVIPARVKARIISTLLRGGIKRSTILPCTFDINIEDELFINAF